MGQRDRMRQASFEGDLTIYGRGDPSIAARFNNGDYVKAINELATRIVAAGVKRVEGDLVGDETYFVGPKYGSGWTWEDLTWYYGAEITPLTVNDNALDLFVKPGPAVGQPAVITTGPPDPLLTIVNKVTTSEKNVRREISIHRGLGENTITIKGSIPLEDRGYTGGIGISHPGASLRLPASIIACAKRCGDHGQVANDRTNQPAGVDYRRACCCFYNRSPRSIFD